MLTPGGLLAPGLQSEVSPDLSPRPQFPFWAWAGACLISPQPPTPFSSWLTHRLTQTRLGTPAFLLHEPGTKSQLNRHWSGTESVCLPLLKLTSKTTRATNACFPTEYVASSAQCQVHSRHSTAFDPWELTPGELLPHGAGPHPAPPSEGARGRHAPAHSCLFQAPATFWKPSAS